VPISTSRIGSFARMAAELDSLNFHQPAYGPNRLRFGDQKLDLDVALCDGAPSGPRPASSAGGASGRSA
jgi:hypothetical protein